MRDAASTAALAEARAMVRGYAGASLAEWSDETLLAVIMRADGIRGWINAEDEALLLGEIKAQSTRVQGAILSQAALPEDVAERHDVQIVDSLAAFDLTKFPDGGVFMVKAPMGAGKTIAVLMPFLKDTRKLGLAAMLGCHRVSLVQNLVKRTGLADYQLRPVRCLPGVGVVVCLPSLIRPDVAAAVPEGHVLALDEVTQVLRSLIDKDINSTAHGGVREVFTALVRRVQAAKFIIAADAHLDAMTLAFLEAFRPERFHIAVQQPVDSGKSATFLSGPGTRDEIWKLILADLKAGKRVWAAFESQKTARAFGLMVAEAGFNGITATGPTKTRAAEAEFLADPDKVSQQYQYVGASPVIGAGVSVEHRTGPRFDAFYYLGDGKATTPLEAIQQLGRVRYAKHWTIAAGVGAKAVLLTRSERLAAAKKAAGREAWVGWGLSKAGPDTTGMSEWVIDRENERAVAKRYFSAGMWVHLEAEKWTLSRVHTDPTSDNEATKDALARVAAATAEELITAPVIDEVTALDIRRDQSASYEDLVAAVACDIRCTLGLIDLTPDDVTFYDDGRIKAKIARFQDWLGLETRVHRDDEELLAHRKFREARRELYPKLYAGIEGLDPGTLPIWVGPLGEDPLPDDQVLADMATRPGSVVVDRKLPQFDAPVFGMGAVRTFVQRATKEIDVAVTSGIVGKMWFRALYPKGNQRGRPRQLDSRQLVNLLRDALDRVGLGLETVSRARKGDASGRHPDRGGTYRVDAEMWATMQALVERRKGFTIASALVRKAGVEAAE